MKEIFVQGWSENYGLSFGGYKIIVNGDVVYETEVGLTTPQISYFLGICHALYKYPNKTIYTNNTCAISWVKRRKVNSKYDALIERVDKAEQFLRTLETISVEYKKL